MDQQHSINAVVIGCGGMARHHVRKILAEFDNTHFPVLCETSESNYDQMAQLFRDAGLAIPPNEPDLHLLLNRYQSKLDVAIIATPHVYHHDQAKHCLQAGLDVFLEKPMVMTAEEAQSLVDTQRQTGNNLVVAFQSSLSPHIQTAAKMLHSGELGQVLNISAVVWQDWAMSSDGSWRQQPSYSGGGFLFDTGAHMLNTVTYLSGEDFREVAAWFDFRQRQVDILAVAIGKLESGTLVTLNGCGDTIPSCSSEVRVFCQGGILRTGIWGGSLEVLYNQEDGWQEVAVPPSRGEWEQFLLVRNGEIDNPSPPEIGWRLANLWDAVKASASRGGEVIQINK